MRHATNSPKATTPAEALVVALYRLATVQREIARHALAELGTHGFFALAVVHRQEPVRVSDVAHALHIDLSVASRHVAALADAGYVDRRPDAEDRRAFSITMTDAGRRVLLESHRRMVDAFSGVLRDWSDADVTALAAALERLRDDYAAATAGDEGR